MIPGISEAWEYLAHAGTKGVSWQVSEVQVRVSACVMTLAKRCAFSPPDKSYSRAKEGKLKREMVGCLQYLLT